MVGGMVIATIEDGDRIYVNCQGSGSERREQCAIYVERNADSEQVRPGDNLWWQGKRAMWTPSNRRVVDKEIPRRSYSGVSPPTARKRGIEL